MDKLDRREALKMLGLGVASVGVASGAGVVVNSSIARTPGAKETVETAVKTAAANTAAAPKASGSENPDAGLWSIVAPFTAGASVGKATLVGIKHLEEGVVQVQLEHNKGGSFQVDVCARDKSVAAPKPIAQTSKCDLFLSNNGGGSSRTNEAEGVATYAIAWVLDNNEAEIADLGLRTMRERWQS